MLLFSCDAKGAPHVLFQQLKELLDIPTPLGRVIKMKTFPSTDGWSLNNLQKAKSEEKKDIYTPPFIYYVNLMVYAEYYAQQNSPLTKEEEQNLTHYLLHWEKALVHNVLVLKVGSEGGVYVEELKLPRLSKNALDFLYQHIPTMHFFEKNEKSFKLSYAAQQHLPLCKDSAEIITLWTHVLQKSAYDYEPSQLASVFAQYCFDLPGVEKDLLTTACYSAASFLSLNILAKGEKFTPIRQVLLKNIVSSYRKKIKDGDDRYTEGSIIETCQNLMPGIAHAPLITDLLAIGESALAQKKLLALYLRNGKNLSFLDANNDPKQSIFSKENLTTLIDACKDESSENLKSALDDLKNQLYPAAPALKEITAPPAPVIEEDNSDKNAKYLEKTGDIELTEKTLSGDDQKKSMFIRNIQQKATEYSSYTNVIKIGNADSMECARKITATSEPSFIDTIKHVIEFRIKSYKKDDFKRTLYDNFLPEIKKLKVINLSVEDKTKIASAISGALGTLATSFPSSPDAKKELCPKVVYGILSGHRLVIC